MNEARGTLANPKPSPRDRDRLSSNVPPGLVLGKNGDCVEYWHGRCNKSAAQCPFKHDKQNPEIASSRRGTRRDNDEELSRPGKRR